ncbi:hypothetical protein CLOM_g18126 [Closterium sp. NIES-68]|nr:hypothetical protein CLOM_g18126 [Closterium sp. NIES-68]
MSKHLQRSHQCQALERNAVEQRNSCQEHLHGVVSEDKPSPKAIPCQGTSEGKSSEQTNPGASEGKLVVEEVEILEFSNDDIAGPINQKPLTVPQDAPLDLMQEELLPPAALSMGGLDFPYDWSTFSSQDPEPESLETPRGELPTIASLESLQEEGVGSPVSVLRRHGSSPGSATSLSDKPLETVHSSNSLHSGDNLDLHLGGLAGRVLLYPEFGQEEGADFSGVMEDDEMWASLSSPEASEGWLAAACLATCWPKAPRSKRRRVSMEASGTDASAPSASVGAAASDEGKGPGDLIEGFTVADSANLDGLQAAASESMASEPTVFASASASLFSGYIPHALSCNSLSAVAAPQSASASAAAATSWVQPRTAFLQALLEDVRRPKRVRGSAASASTWRYVAVEDHHDGASSDGYAGQTRGPLRTPKFKRDAATAFGPTALGVLHLLPGSSSSASLYTSESAEAWNSPSGSGSPGWSDTVAASAAGAGPAGAGSGWFRTNSTSSLESFSGTSNASAIPSLALPLPAFVSNVSGGVRRCVHCKSTKTPQWRMGPAGPKTLCNACGVRFKKGKLCPEYRPANSPEYEESKHSNQHRKILAMRSSSMAAAAS